MNVLKFFSFIVFVLLLSACGSSTEVIVVGPAEEPIVEEPIDPIVEEPAPAISCPWIRKREFTCDGVTYISGLPSCTPYYPRSVFCKKELENDIQACFNDSSAETQRCQFEKIGRNLLR